MVYHRPVKALLKHRERVWSRHQGADLEVNRAETLTWLCVHTRVCAQTHTHVFSHEFHFIHFHFIYGEGSD